MSRCSALYAHQTHTHIAALATATTALWRNTQTLRSDTACTHTHTRTQTSIIKHTTQPLWEHCTSQCTLTPRASRLTGWAAAPLYCPSTAQHTDTQQDALRVPPLTLMGAHLSHFCEVTLCHHVCRPANQHRITDRYCTYKRGCSQCAYRQEPLGCCHHSNRRCLPRLSCCRHASL